VASSPDSSVGAVDALVAAVDGLEAVDLSPTLRSAMPRFFAHPEFHIIDDARLIERDQYHLQTLGLPEHVDAPAHALARATWCSSTSAGAATCATAGGA
jgi:hypothetical protein